MVKLPITFFKPASQNQFQFWKEWFVFAVLPTQLCTHPGIFWAQLQGQVVLGARLCQRHAEHPRAEQNGQSHVVHKVRRASGQRTRRAWQGIKEVSESGHQDRSEKGTRPLRARFWVLVILCPSLSEWCLLAGSVPWAWETPGQGVS